MATASSPPIEMRGIRPEQVRALQARLAGILAVEGGALVVRVRDGVLCVTAHLDGQVLRLESDLHDPDAELVLAAKLVRFVERARLVR